MVYKKLQAPNRSSFAKEFPRREEKPQDKGKRGRNTENQ
jgi:hypothetical protein